MGSPGPGGPPFQAAAWIASPQPTGSQAGIIAATRLLINRRRYPAGLRNRLPNTWTRAYTTSLGSQVIGAGGFCPLAPSGFSLHPGYRKFLSVNSFRSMTEHGKEDHWEQLALNLGAVPPPPDDDRVQASADGRPEPERAQQTEQPEVPLEAPPANPVVPAPAKVSQPEAPAQDWDKLADELGVVRPPEPSPISPPQLPSEEPGQSERSSGKAPDIPSFAKGISADREPQTVEVSSGKSTPPPASEQTPEGSGSEEAPEKPDKPSVDVDEPTGGPAAASPVAEQAAPGSDEPTEKKPTRKRRKRRRRPGKSEARSANDTVKRPRSAGPEESSPSVVESAAGTAPGDSVEGSPSASGMADPPAEQSKRRRSGRRRTPAKGNSKAAEAGAAEKPASKPSKATATDAAGPEQQADDWPDLAAPEEEEEVAQTDEKTDDTKKGTTAKDSRPAKPSHRGIPSWQDAVDVLISVNLEARSKKGNGSSSSHSRGGRGRGGASSEKSADKKAT